MLTALTGKKLYSMTFYANGSSEIDVRGMQVYLAEVDFTTLPDKFAQAENGVINLYRVQNDQISGNFTATNFTAVKVFDSDYNFRSGANVIEFDAPYTYNGGNLLVIIQNTSNGTTHSEKTFYGVFLDTNGVSRERYDTNNASYARSFLAKCTFGCAVISQCNVTWKDTDGTVLETDTNVTPFTKPSYNGEKNVPYRTDGTNIYASDKLPEVIGSVTYTVAEYTVTWVDTDGNVLETDTNVIPFTTPEFNGTITVPENHTLLWTDGTGFYTDGHLPYVTGNVTCTAVFAKQIAVGVEFRVGDTVDFGDYYINHDDEHGIDARNGYGVCDRRYKL